MSSATAIPQRHVEHCMGTVFSFDVRAPGAQPSAVADAVAWLHRVDATFSTYRADSEISRLARGELDRADCSPDVQEVLDRCESLAAETDGWFSAWPGGRLDPSGYVKGWAIERAADILTAAGSVNHCVNGGGDVQCAGSAAPGRPWTVGIADPARPDQVIATVTGDGLAVATSGTSERGAHILDPRTGRPVTGGPAAVTVIGTRLALVDAYATAAFVMGDGAADWLAGLAGITALIVHRDGRLQRVGAMPDPRPDPVAAPVAAPTPAPRTR